MATKAQLIALLAEQGIEADVSLSKSELEAKLAEVGVGEQSSVAPEDSGAPATEKRFHRGIEVLSSEDVVMEQHPMERLHLADGTTTIIPK